MIYGIPYNKLRFLKVLSDHIYIYIYKRYQLARQLLEVYRSSASGSASADIRMNFDIRIPIRIGNISCGCHADIKNNKRIIF